VADSPAFESSVTNVRRAAGTGAITLIDESATAKAGVRAADDTAAAAALGLSFGSSETRGDVLVCRTRPDEWMIFGSAEAVGAHLADLDLTGYASTVDITHSRLMLRITGTMATKALEKVCSIDFSDSMTPNGACVGASVAKVGCDIIRDDIDAIPSYLILCDRSFGQYLFDALIDAKSEFA
jgi:heterotetrameric sarcosine oxidase gamma subunit